MRPMNGTIILGDITIQPIVEQTGDFFEPKRFFRELTYEMLLENLDWLRPRYLFIL
jgi:hypothetical protein